MSSHTFDPKCPDCRPCLIGPDGKVLPEDDPAMACVLAAWFSAPYEEQLAFHNVCSQNSREAARVELASKNQKNVLVRVHVGHDPTVKRPDFRS